MGKKRQQSAAAKACMVIGMLLGVGAMMVMNIGTNGKVPGGAIGGAIGGGVGGALGALVGSLFNKK